LRGRRARQIGGELGVARKISSLERAARAVHEEHGPHANEGALKGAQSNLAPLARARPSLYAEID
jgi:hypothetical protein